MRGVTGRRRRKRRKRRRVRKDHDDDDGEEGWRREDGRRTGGRADARRVSGVVGTPKIASRYDDARSGPILDFSSVRKLESRRAQQ